MSRNIDEQPPKKSCSQQLKGEQKLLKDVESQNIYLTTFALGVAPILMLFKAVVLSNLWEWYFVPVFDLPSLPVSSAFALVLADILLRLKLPKDADNHSTTEGMSELQLLISKQEDLLKRNRLIIKGLRTVLVATVVVWAIGWIGTFFL